MSSTMTAIAAMPQSFHFCRVTRLENRLLEERIVDSDEVHEVASQNLGLFAGGYGTIALMERQLSILARSESAERWVVAVATKKLLDDTERRLGERDELAMDDGGCGVGFRADHLRLTTVEALSGTAHADVDGVILYDPACHVHRAREFQRFDGTNHDRAQIIADFLATRAIDGSPPLLCLMALKPPKSCCTSRAAEAYMREAWLFADPFSLSFVGEDKGDSDA